MNKGYQMFRKCMSERTDNKSLCSGLTYINEVRKCIVYMTYDIFGVFYRWFYDIVYDIKLLY